MCATLSTLLPCVRQVLSQELFLLCLEEARRLDSECRQDAAIARDLEDSDEDSACSTPDRQSYQPGRDTFVKFGFSRFWSVPLHSKLKELFLKCGLRWLRIRMAYHAFPNLQSIFSADLGRKVMSGVKSADFTDPNARPIKQL